MPAGGSGEPVTSAAPDTAGEPVTSGAPDTADEPTAGEPVTAVLHPGAMGATVAAACRGRVLWVSRGRSAATRARAAAAGLAETTGLDGIVGRADTVISVCPPHAAEAVAASVAAAGFEVPKAWRWSGEMAEIADTFAAAGLPDGFHRAAAAVYGRLEGFKDAAGLEAADALAALAAET